MNDSPSNAPQLTNQESASQQPDLNIDKRKLNLSQSENTLNSQKVAAHKPLNKVKSWSSNNKEHNQEAEGIIESDLARSLTKLDVSESNEVLNSNLGRARDSLDSVLKDEQNMPKSSLLERSMLQPKFRNIPGSPKSSPQLGENFKASSSKVYWDPFDRQGKKNRKDIKRKNKSRNMDSPRSDGTSGPSEGKKQSTAKKDLLSDSSVNYNEETSLMEPEESSHKFKFPAKNSKSVVFTNEVLVVYFNNEDVIGEEKEPLKKEVEQQTRNKEMRRVHLNKTQEKYNLCLF